MNILSKIRPTKTRQVASAIIRKDEQIVMVQQPGDDGLYWFIPGGIIESDELLNEALIREIKEETGLTVDKVGKLAYVTQVYKPRIPAKTIAYVVEIESWSGILQPDDPDNLTHDAAFVPIAEALERLNHTIWTPMREPLQAYLSQKVPAGRVWQYRQNRFREYNLLACI